MSSIRLLLVGVLVVTFTATTAAAAVPTVTLALNSSSIVYGASVKLSGRLASGRAGEQVTVFAQPCRFTAPVAVGSAVTTRGGAFAYRFDPLINTTLYVSVGNNVFSAPKAVRVKPRLQLKKVGGGYRASVFTTNGQFLDGRTVVLQRLRAGRWANVAGARLEKASSEFALTLTSAVTFARKLPRGTKLRFVLPRSQATCYTGAASAPISS